MSSSADLQAKLDELQSGKPDPFYEAVMFTLRVATPGLTDTSRHVIAAAIAVKHRHFLKLALQSQHEPQAKP
jgi:hypothetical protein